MTIYDMPAALLTVGIVALTVVAWLICLAVWK